MRNDDDVDDSVKSLHCRMLMKRKVALSHIRYIQPNKVMLSKTRRIAFIIILVNHY